MTHTLAQVAPSPYASAKPTSLRRVIDAWGKGEFCAACHNMLYPVPPEESPKQQINLVDIVKMEPGLKRLTNSSGRDVNAIYSPKGDLIIWVTDSLGNWTIWSMNNDGSNKNQLTSRDFISGWPSWSPDGQEIAYWAWDLKSNSCDIWKMKSDGTFNVKLTTDGKLKGPPAWSPRGDRIAYTSSLTGNIEIHIMNADGGQKKQITTGHRPEAYVENSVYWHVDGQRLYYTVVVFPLPDGTFPSIPGDVAFVEVFMINADTLEEKCVIPRLHDNIRSVSPDGKTLVGISLRSTNYGLWIMNDDGTNQTRLTWDNRGDRAPKFSPDGRRIVYWSLASGSQADIWIINLDGSNNKQLTKNIYQDVYPSWSPDGKTIIFESDRAGSFDIWQLSLDMPINVDVTFESCVTNGNEGKALLTITPTGDSEDLLRVEKCSLHFDWHSEEEYHETSNLIPETISISDNVFKTNITFFVPNGTDLGYHFYDVRVQFTNVKDAVASLTRIYEHSASDLEIGTFEHSQCDRLSKELQTKLKLINEKSELESQDIRDNEILRMANTEMYSAESQALIGNYVLALSHYKNATTLLTRYTQEASEIDLTSALPLSIVTFLVVLAVIGTYLSIRLRKERSSVK